MIFLQPVWLLLALPLGLFLWRVCPSSKLIRWLRLGVVALILPAAAGLSLKLPSRQGTLVVAADRSRSMPADAEARQRESIELIQTARPARSRMAVVSFGEQVAVEHPPQTGRFTEFTAQINPHASNLAEAVQTAVSLIPAESPGRILLLTDGRWTGRDLTRAASLAAARGIAVDYRLIERPSVRDTAVYRIEPPESVSPGESFLIHVWVQAPQSREFSYVLQRNSTPIASGTRTAAAGLTRLTFRDTAQNPGTLQYEFRIPADVEDPIPENNTARMFVGVRGDKPILCVSGSGDTGYADLLRASRLDVVSKPVEACGWALEDLTNYSAVILEDLPANRLTVAAMETIADWVRTTGAGFMMTGGKHSFGPGGYFRSPIEPILPVSMELRKEHRKLSLAIVVALDRSGSMAVPVGGGKTKMDLANLATAQVLDMLSATDEFGVIAVDSSPHLIVDLCPADRAAAQRDKILRIHSQGGGIFVYEALSNAASLLSKAEAMTRHIILFADAADAEEPGDYITLLEKCREAQITVSVIGLGTESDPDAGLLKDIAARGEGRCLFTESAEELPRLFAQDTFVVARSSFLEEPTVVELTAALSGLTRCSFEPMPPVGGYNLCYLRPQASLGAVTVDEYKAPIVASWQAGAGRSLCYTGQVNGPFTGAAAGWSDFGSFHSSLVRWAAGRSEDLGGDMLLTQEVHGGLCRIKLHLDPQRDNPGALVPPQIRILQALPGEPAESSTATMYYEDADTLCAEIPLSGPQTLLSTVYVDGHAPVSLPPVCLPYSPEYRPAQEQFGPDALRQIARTTGGVERISLSEIWDDMPSAPQYLAMGPWLLLLAVIIFLLEIFERRTGLLSALKVRRRKTAAVEAVAGTRPARQAGRSRSARQAARTQEAAASPSSPETESSDLLDAMSRARRSARIRTDKKVYTLLD